MENGTLWHEEPMPCKKCDPQSCPVSIPGECCPHCSECNCSHVTFMFEASRRFTFLHCFAPTCYGKQWTSFSHTFTIVTVRTPGNWSEWSECSATCGKGMQTSVRTCYAGDTRPTSHCPHPTLRTQICHKPCPGITWNSWTLTSLCRYSL